MREFDRELLWTFRIAKAETRFIPRRTLCMATCADNRLSAFKELCPMTADAGGVIGKVSDVRKVSHLLPVFRRHFMTSVARLLVLFSSVGEPRVINRRFSGWCGCCPSSSASLAGGRTTLRELVGTKNDNERYQRQDQRCDEVPFHLRSCITRFTCLAPDTRAAAYLG